MAKRNVKPMVVHSSHLLANVKMWEWKWSLQYHNCLQTAQQNLQKWTASEHFKSVVLC